MNQVILKVLKHDFTDKHPYIISYVRATTPKPLGDGS